MIGELWKKATEHSVTWFASGVQTWVTGAFPLAIMYPNWAIDLSAKVLVPAKIWVIETGWPAASNYFEAAMDVVGMLKFGATA